MAKAGIVSAEDIAKHKIQIEIEAFAPALLRNVLVALTISFIALS